jgi:hypothetical protein
MFFLLSLQHRRKSTNRGEKSFSEAESRLGSQLLQKF